ncbi:cobalt transporter [Mesorhizobium sp. NBSH29]|uniref:CbtA family protein n=1 Tax=Mesorhizobium sp. NBSH29 TaxID=2654249 RepID=UPI001896A36F|nr:CbtA family protein [Mesorhizobium sp. NBSH29]QPC86643.1 cobalt transporter [Mesorhizobium sp. NBSH29]
MTLFRNVVFIAAIAGLLSGIAMAAMQTFATVPLILAAETYENAAPANHDHDTQAANAGAAATTPVVEAHAHGEDAWEPADGFERFAYTAAANIVTAIGFALVLVAVSEALGGILSWRQGLFWGFAGFAVFTLAPGLGLPPELPGMPAADVSIRQAWWIGTVLATAGGLALLAFRNSLPFALLGVALIVAPHIIGAPQPVSHGTAVPAELLRRFVVAATLTNLMFWMVLGAVVGLLRSRFTVAGEPVLKRGLA